MRVFLTYFRRPSGKYLTDVETTIEGDTIEEIWEEVHELRRMGRLPGLRPNAGRDLLIMVDVPDHPKRAPYLAIPPLVDEEDVTPTRIPTGEMAPIVRVPLEEIPRTTTRDVVKSTPVEVEEEVTPVDGKIPEPSDR